MISNQYFVRFVLLLVTFYLGTDVNNSVQYYPSYEINLPNIEVEWLTLLRSRVQISARRPAILPEIFHASSEFLQANSGRVPSIKP
jgi:hypothetical protein